MNKNILKKYLVYILLITLSLIMSGCSSSPGSSSTPRTYFKLSGNITDFSTGLPISNAAINLNGNITYTNRAGFYELSIFTSGSYEIKVLANKYYSYMEEIELSADMDWNKALYPFQGGGLITGRINPLNSSQDYSGDKLYISNDTTNIKNTNFNSATSSVYKENNLLVKFKSDNELVSIQQKSSLKKMGKGKLRNSKGSIVQYQIPNEKNMKDVLDEYQSLPEVEWAQPNYIYHTTSIPNDYYYPLQWGNHKVNLEAAYDHFTENNEVTVAVIDTGIIPDHPDLIGKILSGADFVGQNDETLNEMTDDDPTDETKYPDISHGTHVAGIIGATTDNSKGIAGVYNQIKILPIRAINHLGIGLTIDLVESIEYAIEKNVDIINLSLAISGYDSSLGKDDLLHEAIIKAVEKGIVVIAAAGNSGGSVNYPAAFPEVIAVGSINSNNQLSDFSCYGPNLDLVAPGEDILSTSGYMNEDGSLHSDYYYMSGTSMATPYVSGVAAILKANGQNDIENLLKTTAADMGTKGRDNIYDYGLVDAYAALRGKPLAKPDIYIGSINGNDLIIEGISGIWDNDKYYLADAPVGEHYLVALRDLNNNNIIDSGDYFGQSEIIDIKEYATIKKDINLYYVDDSSRFQGLRIINN